MTDQDIKSMAEGLSDLERKNILSARKVADKTYEIPRGGARGLHGRGLVWRSSGAHYLSEKGIELRTYLQEQSNDTN